MGIVVQLTALWPLTRVVGWNYLVSTVIAVGIAIVHNFMWHRCWTWRDSARAGRATVQLLRFAAGNGVVSLAGNLVMMVVLVSGANVSPLVSNGVAIAVSGLLNFWMGDAVVFVRSRARAR